jgi:hypothetical protein
MNAKTVSLNLVAALSTTIYCVNIHTLLENRKELAQSLYANEFDLSSLRPEPIMIEIQTLKEKRTILKHIIAQEIGFFNNYDMFKGIVGTYLGTIWLLKSTFYFCMCIGGNSIISHTTIESSPATIRSVITIIPDRLAILAIPSGCIAAFSLWLLKKSLFCLRRGWYKKEKTMKKLAKVENLLAQYDNYLKNSFYN